jgi:hypothetical protein
MQLHFQRNVGQDSITGDFSGYNFHNLGPTPELLVEALNDVGCPKRDPFLRRKIEEGQAGIDAALQTFHCGRDGLVPFSPESVKAFPCLLL